MYYISWSSQFVPLYKLPLNLSLKFSLLPRNVILHAAVFLASLFVLRAGTILLSSFTLLSNLSGSYRSDITTKLLLLGFYCSAILV